MANNTKKQYFAKISFLIKSLAKSKVYQIVEIVLGPIRLNAWWL